METKEIKINIPEGYEVDKENSTFECIKFKKKIKVNTWQDIPRLHGFYTLGDSKIKELDVCHNMNPDNDNINVFINKKYLKSALALAQISQLMPYYGGEITNEEWMNNERKFAIVVHNGELKSFTHVNNKVLIAFHTEAQRTRFMFFQKNVQLVKDFYMIS